jgi:ABC-2 type transport system ATP-binding protein
MWAVIRDLVAGGTTLLLTTQYLDEADELADDIVVVDHGTIIAQGSADDLKNRIGGDVVEFVVTDPAVRMRALAAVARLTDDEPSLDDDGRISLRVGQRGSEVLVEVVRRLDAEAIVSRGLAVRRPSLDDVFLSLTGHAAEAEAESAQVRR